MSTARKLADRKIERCATGVAELDAILGGGLPKGSLILLSGNAGSGKTILSTQFLHNGATKYGEKGIYASFAENRDAYFRNMLTLGLDMRSLEEKGLFKFMDFSVMTESGMENVLDMIMSEVDKSGVKRLAVDSINAILQDFGDAAESRQLLRMLFGKVVKNMGVTTLLIGEIPFGEFKSGFGVEEFVVDGIIFLRTAGKAGEGTVERRTLNVAKMRGVSLGRSTFEYLIDERYNGLGIIALPAKAGAMTAPEDRLSSGVEGLDKMLHGGVYRDSITLVEGMAGIGKTTLCLHFLVAAAEKGETSLFISFEEPIGQIRRMLKGFGIDYERPGDRFIIQSYVPEALTPLHYYGLLRDVLEEFRPSVLAIDTITAMNSTLSGEDFASFMRYLQLLCKEKHLTVFLTSTMGTLVMSRESGISTLADNIFVMRYRELENMMTREVFIMKTRGSPHEKRVASFEITGKGIVIQA